jgi:glycosyltransferase involved in cell wall biosynthesis
VIKLGIVCDISGKDDEGMKKVARSLALVVDRDTNYSVTTIATRDCIGLAREFDRFHFIGGPSYRTIIVSYLCHLLNRDLKCYLTFTNPFLGRFSLLLLKWMKPKLCLVSSQEWLSVLAKLGVPAILFNISGVDTDKFDVVSYESKLALREKLGFPDDKLIVLHVGHLKPDRNIGSLVSLQKNGGQQVVVVGSTTTKQSQAELLSLREAGCIVITEYVGAIEEYYQASDCYVFPTINPRAAIQIPLSVLEALSTGLPIITTEFGGLRDIFGDYDGLFYYFKKHEFGILSRLIEDHCKSDFEVSRDVKFIDWISIASELTSIYEQ